MNFKIVDRVRATGMIDYFNFTGECGVVIGNASPNGEIPIEWDNVLNGVWRFTADGRLTERGRYARNDDVLELIDNKKRQIDFIMSLLT